MTFENQISGLNPFYSFRTPGATNSRIANRPGILDEENVCAGLSSLEFQAVVDKSLLDNIHKLLKCLHKRNPVAFTNQVDVTCAPEP